MPYNVLVTPVPTTREVEGPMDEGTRVGRLVDAVCDVVVGKREVVEVAVATLLAGGHLLVEDVPGVGKTTLARALARAVDCRVARVQATSDLLPSDVIGVTIYDERTHEFSFQPGPLFTNILLVDEINRATPRTQSCLLQAMSEGEVTVDRVTHTLDEPFFVVATQNPAEQVGTYLLPESQLDRFAARIRMGYPDRADEERMLVDQRVRHPLEDLSPVIGRGDLVLLRRRVREVRVADPVARYILDLTRATRTREDVSCGASPRASLTLTRMAQARALLDGRDYCVPDDVKRLAVPVLAHRLILPSSLRAAVDEQERVVALVVAATAVP